MLSDDTYRSRLTAVIEDIERWSADAKSVARVEQSDNGESWRVNVQPDAPNACPFELLIRRDQRYDLAIASETYEDQSVESLDVFRPLIDAIAAGRVLVRRCTSAATGLTRSVETLVTFDDGALWRGVREVEAGHPEAESLLIDRHFVPYGRQ